ncbi:TPA: hypothetical protein ACHTCR_004720 [Pseudomonas putida]|uniref:hypothetical protein n=1 Tax=Pseudomonas putida TaxID=303 RepID=UPI000F3FB35E|nr:hypothetical protein [Pseudomonas putida]RNF66495.1 hypothetical protein EFJ98_24450 [Pseudomonas putida]
MDIFNLSRHEVGILEHCFRRALLERGRNSPYIIFKSMVRLDRMAKKAHDEGRLPIPELSQMIMVYARHDCVDQFMSEKGISFYGAVKLLYAFHSHYEVDSLLLEMLEY